MRIDNIHIATDGTEQTLSARLGDSELVYRVPAEFDLQPRADPFLPPAFFPAALTGDALTVSAEYAASPLLRRGMATLQEIFCCWNPDLHPFRIVASDAPAQAANTGVAAFFSGGIDGLYTLLSHQAELTHLIYINGFDFRIPADAFAAQAERLRRVTAAFGKALVPVDTSFLELTEYHRIRRTLSHGSCLAGVAHALAFPRYYIPATYTYNELHPWGSHPLVDRHWSTEASVLVHDGADASRIQKTRRIAQSQIALDNLIVCWRLPDRNCGECGKCLRTRIALYLLGVESDTFPAPPSYREVASYRPESEADRVFYLDELALAREVGDSTMERALQKVTRAPMFRASAKEIDARLFNSRLLRGYRRLRRRSTPQRAPVTGLAAKNR